jgi:hypothetical protein
LGKDLSINRRLRFSWPASRGKVVDMNGRARSSLHPVVGVALVTVLLLAVLAGSASAHKIVGRDGKIHACYKVKGKPRGALRAVRGRAKCRRGERKVAWTVAGAQSGAAGLAGAPGTDAAIGALSARMDALEARVEKLEALVGTLCSQISLVTSLLPIEPFSCP